MPEAQVTNTTIPVLNLLTKESKVTQGSTGVWDRCSHEEVMMVGDTGCLMRAQAGTQRCTRPYTGALKEITSCEVVASVARQQCQHVVLSCDGIRQMNVRCVFLKESG